MRLPTQSVPVQRAVVGFTRAGAEGSNALVSSLYAPSNGVVGSAESGVQADGLFDDILGGISKVANVALPILGGFGLP